MRIRKATKEDFVELHKLICEIFPSSDAAIGARDEFLVAEEGEVVGFAHYCEGKSTILLKGLGVREGWRRKGAAGMMVGWLATRALNLRKKLIAKTARDSAAFRIYVKLGFCEGRERGGIVDLVLRPPN